MQNFSKNVVFVLALVAAGFLVAWLRFRPYLEGAGEFTDGQETYDVHSASEVRYAVWERGTELNGEVNSRESEFGPALSPDGRYLLFVNGAEERSGDLWIAEVIEGRLRDPRPLIELNTAAAEIAPAFSREHLYFASDRSPAGDFDLFRASYEEGRFGAVEKLVGVNTPADEVDPAPNWAATELVFSSNRGHDGRAARRNTSRDTERLDFDLFECRLEGALAGEVSLLDSVSSDFDDRDPVFTRDGNALFFASDRRGDFDLYRAAHRSAQAAEPEEESARFLPPRRLLALADERAQRGPSPSEDGFQLTYEVEVTPGDFDLFRARSRELFRNPGRPVGWLELALLAALLLLALLARLSARWSGLEVLYKCLLVSLLAHLLLLWWFQHVHPETERIEFEEEGQRIRVHLLSDPSGGITRNAERAGVLEVNRKVGDAGEVSLARAELSREEAVLEPSALELKRASAPRVAAPSREATVEQREPVSIERVQVARQTPVGELRSGGVPQLALVHESEAAVRSRVASGLPTRAPSSEVAASPVPTSQVELARPGLPNSLHGDTVALATAARLDSGAERSSAADSGHDSLQLRQPALESQKLASESSELSLGSSQSFEARSRASDPGFSTSPASVSPRSSSPALPENLGERGSLASLDRDEVALPGRASSDASRVKREVASGFELPVPGREASLRAEAGPEGASLAATDAGVSGKLESASFRRTRSSEPADLAPARFASKSPDAPKKLEPLEPLERRDLQPLETPAIPSVASVTLEPENWDHTPYQARSGDAKLKALEKHGGSRETEQAVASGLAYLAGRQRQAGNWGRDFREEKYLETTVGKTGLSMLAFMGAGHTQDSDSEYSGAVERALQYLLRGQDEETGHFGDSGAYSHAIATYALAECFALTEDSRLEQPLRLAVRQITRHQIDSNDPRLDGGWGYYYPDGRTFDRWPRASVTVWQIMALESARLAGLDVEDSVFGGAKRFLARCWDGQRGAFRYSHDPERLSSGYPILPGSTPASLFALSLLGEDLTEPQFGPARTYVLERKPRRLRPRSDDAFVNRAEGNLYFWYYSTLALFRAGGPAWQEWNVAMKKTLVESQSDDGSWRAASPYALQFAGDSDSDRCYSTAMCVLTLEVYYRYFTPLLKVE